MKLSECIVGLSALCLLGGCSAAGVDGPETRPPAKPKSIGAGEPKTSDLTPPASSKGGSVEEPPLVRGYVSGTFGVTDSGECRPLGVPMTAFLTDAFGQDALVEDVATATSATECRREQVLDAGADAWATLAYQAICLGGGDASLCGAQATRLCAVETMMRWAEPHVGALTTTDSILHFNYVVLPQSESSRRALYLRTMEEAVTLMKESETVLDEHARGARYCPDEDYEKIAATSAGLLTLYAQISAHL